MSREMVCFSGQRRLTLGPDLARLAVVGRPAVAPVDALVLQDGISVENVVREAGRRVLGGRVLSVGGRHFDCVVSSR